MTKINMVTVFQIAVSMCVRYASQLIDDTCILLELDFRSIHCRSVIIRSFAWPVQGAHRVGHANDRSREICKQCERELVGLRSKLESLKKQVMELEPLKRALARSEERNKQLVEVTQQWAIECQEKDSHIAVVETQYQQIRQERELFKKKLAKYKRQASVDREQKVPDCQFEELREELGYRRELYDKVWMAAVVHPQLCSSIVLTVRGHNATDPNTCLRQLL